jgi:hypothetical protein
MEKSNRQLQARLEQLESEIRRLRSLNEKISLNSVTDKSPSPGHLTMESRPLSPPPEGSQLTSVGGQNPPREDSNPPSPSDGSY